jgi:hypothetical protein
MTLTAGLLGLWLLGLTPAWSFLPPAARAVLALLLLFSPGPLTFHRVGSLRRLGFLPCLLYGVALAGAAHALLFMATHATGLHIGFVRFLTPVWLLGLLVRSWIRRKAPTPAAIAPEGEVPPATGRGVIAGLLVTLAVVLFFSSTAGPMYQVSKDTLDHIGYLEEIRATGQVFPSTAFYRDDGRLGLDPRKSLYHPLLATAAEVGRVSADTLWRTLPGMYSLFLLLCVHLLGTALTGRPVLGLATVIAYVFLQGGGPWGEYFREIAYPNQLARSFFFLIVPPLVAVLRGRRGADRFLVLMVAFLLPAVHVYFLIQLGVLMLGFVPWIFLRPSERSARLRRYAGLGAALVVVSLPFAAVLFSIYAPGNPIHRYVEGVAFLGRGRWVMDPAVFAARLGPAGLLAIPASLLLLRRAASSWEAYYLVATCWIPPLVILNPLLLPALQGVLGYLPYRLVWLVPTAFLYPFLWKAFPPAIPARGRLLRTVGWGLALMVAVYAAARSARDLTHRAGSLEREPRNTHRAWKGLLDFLDDEVPGPAVVLSDPATSYSIPAYTPHYVVCTLDQHSPPNDTLALDRILLARTFFSPMSTHREARRALIESGADYVAVNLREPGTGFSNYWSLTSEQAADLAGRLEAFPMLYERIYRDPATSLFRVLEGPPAWREEWEWKRSGLLDRTVMSPEEIPFSAVRDDVAFEVGRTFGDRWSGRERKAPEADVILAAHRIEPAGVDEAGRMRLRVTTWWTLENEPPPPGKFVVYYRFDTEFPRGPLFHPAYGKLYRKLQEKRTGELYRFRSDHLLTEGLLPPDLWSPGTVVRDDHVLKVPGAAHDGEYRVSILLEKEAHAPNYLWSDFLRNDDRLEGPEVDRISLGGAEER